MATGPALDSLVCPLPAKDPSGGSTIITSPFGYRPSTGSFHYGDDWGTTDGIEIGTSAHAVEDGVIISAGNALPNAAGVFVWLLGDSGYGWKYFHLLDYDAKLVGYRVTRGQQIARVGKSGTSAAHLHLQCHAVNGSRHPDAWRDNSAIPVTSIWQRAISAGRWPDSWPDTIPPHTPTPNPTPNPEDDMPRYIEWSDEDRHALAQDVAGVVGNGEGMTGFVSTQDLRRYMVAQTNLLAAIADKLGIGITWNQGVPIPQDQ